MKSKRKSLVLPEALEEQIAAFAEKKQCGYQEMAEQALRLGLNMLRMQSDVPIRIVRRKESSTPDVSP